MTGPSKETVELLLERAGGLCERCGNVLRGERGFHWSVHHRLPRGRGGDNGLSGLAALCGHGTAGCHGRVESYRIQAYEDGWLVRTGHDPANSPVWLHDGRCAWFTDDGRYSTSAPVVGAA